MEVAGTFPARVSGDTGVFDAVAEHGDAIQEKRLRINGPEQFPVPVRAITPDAFQDPLETGILLSLSERLWRALGRSLLLPKTEAKWQAALEMVEHHANPCWTHPGVWHDIVARKRRTEAETPF